MEANAYLIFALTQEIIIQIITDVIRSIHFVMPRNLTALKFRLVNGEPLSASLRQECESGRCDGESWTDDYYFRLGLLRLCTEGKKHGGVHNVLTAKTILEFVNIFEKYEKLLYALATAGVMQGALAINIKEFDHPSGADIYTRLAVLLAIFTISFQSGPFYKSSTYDRLKEDMNEYIEESGKREPRHVFQEDFVRKSDSQDSRHVSDLIRRETASETC